MLLLGAALSGWSQSVPFVFARGVTNAFTEEPAPAHAGLGGLIEISGSRLGPPEGATAAPPWPAELAGVRVLINGKPAPLGSVSMGRILAQVPPDAAIGLADVVVETAAGQTTPVRVFIDDRRPSVKTADGSGYGQAWGKSSATSLILSASGLGATDPATGAGEAAAAKPTAAITVYVGGIPANAVATGSATRPGEFEVQIDVPSGARPGDVVALYADRLAANLTVFQFLPLPEVTFLPLPEGAPELRFLADTDLNGRFLIASGPRDDNGCYAAAQFNFAKKTSALAAGCLTTGNQAAVTPLVVPAGGTSIGALVGPPQGEAPAAVSAQVRIFSGAADPLTVNLPAAASALTDTAGGDFAAALPGTPPQVVTIDGQTGETRTVPGTLGAAAGGGPSVSASVNVDGLTHVLSAPFQMGQGRVALVVGDDAENPTRARFAILTLASGDVALSKDFPDGWLPLAGEAAPTRPGAVAAAPRVSTAWDSVRRVFYALAHTADNGQHGFAAFTLDRAAARAVPLPDGWFAPTCTPNILLFNLELSRRVALVGTTVRETAYKAVCTGFGFLQMNLGTQETAAIPSIGQALLNVNGASDVNDYLYATNIDPSRRGLGADTVFVLDGVTGAAFTLNPPQGINGFTSLQPIPGISALVGEATNQAAGDQGLFLFDLDNQTVNVLPVPDGFDRVAQLDSAVFLATRKMVARAVKPGGSQLVMYNLVTGEMTVLPNPDGVASIGPVAQAVVSPGGGQPGPLPTPLPGAGGGTAAAALTRTVAANPKANTVAGVAYDRAGKQIGVVLVRVP